METKKCTKCGKELPVTEFRYRNKAQGKFHSQCKSCEKIRDKIHYQESKTRRDAVKATALEQKAINAKIVDSFKAQGCAKCGEKRLYMLDCHHIDPSTKINTLNQMVKSNSEIGIRQELKKCIVLCANCHREFHYLNSQNNDYSIEQYLNG